MHRHILSLLALLSAGIALVCAKPASPNPIPHRQADGSIIEILKHGDEKAHIVTTTDSLPLISQNGSFYYATLSTSGSPVSSGIVAKSPSLRSADESKVIATLRPKETLNTYASLLSSGKRAQTRGPGLMPTKFPSIGEPKALVILVQFTDVKFTGENPREFFERELNQEGFSDYDATGSAKDWFIANSNGLFRPQFDVYGPVSLPRSMAYYGANNAQGNDIRAVKMIIAACGALDREINYADYDTDNDGIIDNVFIYYAGYGEADYADPNCIWPHSWSLQEAGEEAPVLDGCTLNHYACSSEINGSTHCPDGIGTFVHEFSHVLGLPDLYNTTYASTSAGTPFTPGAYSTLDIGPYNNNGRTPPNYSSYERYALGWMEPLILSKSENCELPPLAESNKAYIVKSLDSKEYYLFENRQQTGNDLYIPGHGMLVWHIDYDERIFARNEVNNNAAHQYVDLVEADGSQIDRDRANDLFPGAARATTFTSSSRPKFSFWSGEVPPVSLHFITEDNSNITFRAVKKGDNPNDDPEASVSDITDSGEPFFTLSGRLLSPERPVDIYSLQGSLIACGVTADTPLDSGVYIILSGDRQAKIIVR